MNWYYKFLVRRPYLVILGIVIFSSACIIVVLTTKEFPDFSDPTLGFEARGTEIGKRLTAWRNLLQETEPSGKLVADPNDLMPNDEFLNINNHKNRKLTKNKKDEKLKKDFKKKFKLLKKFTSNKTISINSETSIKNNYNNIHFKDYEINDTLISNSNNNNDNRRWEYGRNTSYINDEDNKEIVQSKKNKWKSLRNFYPPLQTIGVHMISDGFFCESPTIDYSHLVIERIGYNTTDSLFEINSFLAMCQLEQQILDVDNFDEYCQKELTTDNCCRPWSIPNYVALLSNKTSCFDIDHEDVVRVKNLLLNCFQYFHSMKLSNDCAQDKCRVPVDCTQHNAVYNILNYLTDINFIKLNDTNIFLTSAMIFIPVGKSLQMLPLFHSMEKSNLKNDLVHVIAMDMGLRNALFDECLLSDAWLIALGAIFVMFCMWLYTLSIFVTVMTVIAIIFSLGIAYFIYTLIFEMTFFPFMNLLAVTVIIGIGGDDAFIFVKIWQCTLAERLKSVDGGGGGGTTSPSTSFSEIQYTETLNNLMASTLKHAAISMFVTSLTTAGAFYVSVYSSITSIKCFGIFAGTAIIVNCILMVTWLPASISISERIPCHFGKIFSSYLSQKLHKSINQFGSLLESYTIDAIIKMPLLWVILFGIIGISSCVLVLHWPRLQLPESPDFRLFVNDHPFELYESKFRDKFWFEKSIPSVDNFKLPLRFVWGVLPVDKGDYTNPYSRGDLYFDNNFNISSIESQIWLLNFCKKLKNETFYQKSSGMLLPNCFIENFISLMNRRCIDNMAEVDRTPCCEISKFPFEPYIFELCLPQSISLLYSTPREFFIPGVAGPKFARPPEIGNFSLSSPPIVKAIVIEYESNYSYSMSYYDVKKFVTIIQDWFDIQIKTAPAGMKNGWFISELDFFDLQDTLSEGTVISIGMAMSVSLLVLLFVTFNILISVYAVLTVTFTIFTTVAILVLLGWKLNILESVSICTAIGLAVDFSLHYGIHYRLSSNSDRQSSTTYALTRMIGPTAMAAITTGVAGALMLFSNVLPYIQIGIFLVVVMSVSWLYATFFLMSILKLIGPQYGFMQFNYPNIINRQKKNGKTTKDFNERIQNQTIISEHLLTPSSSAVGDMMNSESHELDSLTSNSLIKPISISETSRPIDFERSFNRKSTYSKDLRSPSTGSAITVVLPDDPDIKI